MQYQLRYGIMLITTKTSTKGAYCTMINYTTLNSNLKRGILNFSEKISKKFSRPVMKFICNMIYGILASKSCLLSEIGRNLNEKIPPDFATFPTKNPPQPLKIRAFRGFGGIIFCSGIKLSEHFDFAFNFQYVTSAVKFSWDFYSVGI